MNRLIALLFFTVNIFGQNVSDIKKEFEANIKTPNTADFARQGNVPISLYAGELNLSIPLINVPIGNQAPLDISLSYNASGFVPSKRSGIIGLNWALNVGGMITREVRGLPDDQRGSPGTLNAVNGYFAHGFIAGKKALNVSGPISTLPTNATINSLNFSSGFLRAKINTLDDKFYSCRFSNTTNGTSDYDYEPHPDIFNFNFNGITGKFFMGNDGEFKIVTNQPNNLKIDISNMNFQLYTNICVPQAYSEIVITDNTGNKYYFGGESKNLEYSVNLGSPTGDPKGTVINAWMLKRIEYSNNKITYFNYKDDFLGTSGPRFCEYDTAGFWHDNLIEKSKFVTLNQNVNDIRELVDSQISQTGGPQSTTISANYGSTIGTTYTLNKKAILENIQGENFNLEFIYSLQAHVFNNTSSFVSGFKNFKEIQLDQINLKYGLSLVKSITFNHLLFGGTTAVNSFPRMFLSGIQETGKNPYTFDYFINNATFPKPSTCAIDHWGFYNGKSANDSGFQLIPQGLYTSSGDFTYTSTIREADINFSKLGQLTKINYPTGGYSEFIYEPHNYSKRLERRSANNFLPQLYTEYGISGGTRIQSVKDFDGISNTNIKDYVYTDGVLLQWPRYLLKLNSTTSVTMTTGYGGTVTINTATSRGYLQSTTINRNTQEGSVVTYSQVRENTSGNGYTINKFTDYTTNPDTTEGINPTIQLTSGSYTPLTLTKNLQYDYNDRSIERGKLLWTKYYSATNVLKQQEDYVYNIDPNRLDKYNATVNFSYAWVQNLRMYYYNNFLTQKTSTAYLNGNSFSTIENYVYSTINNNLKSKSTTNSFGETIGTNYYYPGDTEMLGEPYLTEFANNFMTGIPLKSVTLKNNTEVLSANKVVYEKNSSTYNLLLPKYYFGAKGSANNSDLERKLTIDKYDNRGNVLQYTTENGIPVTFIWGHNRTLLVAKIENATFNEILAALSVSETNLINGGELYFTSINNLRNNLGFAKAMITTYSHAPLVGVSQVIDPKGDVMYYSYNLSNELKTIRDKNDNILNDTEMHYKQ